MIICGDFIYGLHMFNHVWDHDPQWQNASGGWNLHSIIQWDFWGSCVWIHFGFFGCFKEDSGKIAKDIEAVAKRHAGHVWGISTSFVVLYRRIPSLKIFTTLIHLMLPRFTERIWMKLFGYNYYNLQANIPLEKWSGWWLQTHYNAYNTFNSSIPMDHPFLPIHRACCCSFCQSFVAQIQKPGAWSARL